MIFSNAPQFYNQYTAKANAETVSGLWSFSTNPYGVTATSSNQLVTLGQAGALANQGAATSTETMGGIVELGTLAEQASSYDGGALQPTVLQTKNATSTCQVVGPYTVTASTTTGKIDKNCIDQTANYALTGNNTFAGTSIFNGAVTTNSTLTANATTTIAANSLTNGALVLNSLAYKAPSTRGRAFSILTEDGSGNLTFASSSLQFATTTAPYVVSSDTGEKTLFTTNIPGGTLSTGNSLSFKAWMTIGLSNNSSRNIILRLKYGGTTLSTLQLSNSGGATITSWTGALSGILSAQNATGAQVGAIDAWFSSAASVLLGGNTQSNTLAGAAFGTASEDSTALKALTLTAQLQNSAAGDTFTINNAIVTWIK